MFVKVISGGVLSTYECKGVHLKFGEDGLQVGFKNECDSLLTSSPLLMPLVFTEDAELFVMNNEGKTIDTYRWGNSRGLVMWEDELVVIEEDDNDTD